MGIIALCWEAGAAGEGRARWGTPRARNRPRARAHAHARTWARPRLRGKSLQCADIL